MPSMIRFYFILFFIPLLTSCVTEWQRQETFFEQMRFEKHFDLSERESIIPLCSQQECREKYGIIQRFIDQKDYQNALESAISIFDLGHIEVKNFQIVEKIPNKDDSAQEVTIIAASNFKFVMTLSHEAFRSAPYLMIVLVHELGHMMTFHKYWNLIKRTAGLPEEISNVKLLDAFLLMAQKDMKKLELHIKREWWLGIFPNDRLIVDGHEITVTQIQQLMASALTFIDIHEHFLTSLEEVDACLFTIKHRHRLYLAKDSPFIQSQVSYLRSSLLNGSFDRFKLAIEKLFYEAVRKHVWDFLPVSEQEKFKNALFEEMEHEEEEVKLYLSDFDF